VIRPAVKKPIVPPISKLIKAISTIRVLVFMLVDFDLVPHVV